ncbi:hypothetical protein [Pontibacter mangrovi]|uniref:Beta-xylosidase C-terminal Concanavalin A-like domain-containing protein n=1 Tax=Pontibacter mangrovi TaxID=2589816 RepID=A0A501W215_9BACT|nr:hypothetical protein [Pontibacter mangrovi]TPE44023.1 hypothetical protein FJM65_11420 [Pontibacter mangrovi]
MKRKVASELERIPVSELQTVHFKLTVQDGHKLNFAWSPDGSSWNEANKGEPVDGAFLPPWDRGVRVGLSAKGAATASAAFNWFKLNYSKKEI